jgi:hypothetical protein
MDGLHERREVLAGIRRVLGADLRADLDALNEECIDIETQLGNRRISPSLEETAQWLEWRIRAKTALKYKRREYRALKRDLAAQLSAQPSTEGERHATHQT